MEALLHSHNESHLFYFFLFFISAVIVFVDIKTYKIPNIFQLIFLINDIFILSFELASGDRKMDLFFIVFFFNIVMFLLLVTEEKIGGGDKKLLFLYGILLNPITSVFFYSLVYCFYVILNKETRKKMPFSPVIFIAFSFSLLV